MKCKMCGATLKKEGEVCNNCMNQIMKEEEARNDNVKVYEFERKFVLLYQLSQHLETVMIVTIMTVVLLAMATEFLTEALIFLFLVIAAVALMIKYEKYKIKLSKCTFYMTKLVYERVMFFKKIKFEIPYSEIKEISYRQTRLEKKCNIGTIYIKSSSKNLLEKNVFIDSVKNVEKVFATIKEKLGQE